jgi:Protein of unknown function (DUF2844)
VTNRSILLQYSSMIHRSFNKVLAIAAMNSLWAGPVCAGLGSDAAGVVADGTELHGVVNSTSLPQYEIDEITTDTGMRVREYLGRDGVVFAVSWSGPALPDLQRLLGAHYVDYATALAALARPGLHRSLRIASSELVVESGGHLRAYAGRAYLPTRVPAGISTADLR